MDNSYEYTLYTECLYECIKEAKEKGMESVAFDDLDEMIRDMLVDMSMQIVEWKTKIDMEKIYKIADPI